MTAQGSPLTRLRRALAGGDLLAARIAAAELPHVGLDEAAALLVLIALEDPAKLKAATVRLLGASGRFMRRSRASTARSSLIAHESP